jgi:hypothetical protein
VRSRVAIVAALACAGCAVPKQMLAAPDDFADYRAFRLASHEGPRLACAQKYLRRHPRGAWVDEVRTIFEAEESAWFESAKASRTRARDYVVDLPDGPHVDAARALLAMFDEQETDIDMLELLADSRRTAAMLDLESARRKRVSEVLLEEVAALIDPTTMGADLDDPPRALGGALRGTARRTWAAPPTPVREDDLYFVLPTPRAAEGRVAQVRLRLALRRGRVVGGTIEGDELFVHWAEANELRVLDPTSPTDRATAAADIADMLAGALEGRLPASRCTTQPAPGDILSRACDGWHVSVRMGTPPENHDVITVIGPLVASGGKAR